MFSYFTLILHTKRKCREKLNTLYFLVQVKSSIDTRTSLIRTSVHKLTHIHTQMSSLWLWTRLCASVYVCVFSKKPKILVICRVTPARYSFFSFSYIRSFEPLKSILPLAHQHSQELSSLNRKNKIYPRCKFWSTIPLSFANRRNNQINSKTITITVIKRK